MVWWLALVNSVVALITAGFGVAALVRPAMFLASEGNVGRFFPAMYAARAIPLGIAVAVVVWLPVTQPPIAVFLLGVAVLAQAADVVTGVVVRQWGLVAGAAFGTLCHAAGLVALVWT